MEIRKDILPPSEKAERALVAFVAITQSSLKRIFPTEDDVIKYVNNFENPEIAKLFLETGRYYHSAKNYSCPACFPPKHLEKCPNCGEILELPSFLVLIMIISIMERLSHGSKSYQDFYTWIGTREAHKKAQTFFDGDKTKELSTLIDNLRSEWLKENGSTTKITEFFQSFLTKEEKMEFIKSIRYFYEVPELPPKRMGDVEGKPAKDVEEVFQKWEEEFKKEQGIRLKTEQDVFDYIKNNGDKKSWEALPICYNEQNFLDCYGRDYFGQGQGYCRYNYLCRLDKDQKLLNDCFVQTVKTIYDWRSKFVHDMRIPPIRETAILGDFYDDRMIMVELTTKELKPVFERMLKRYFDQFQKTA